MTDEERYYTMLDEIEQLKSENKQLQAHITAKETTQNGTYIDINTHFRDIEKLQSENTRLKAERDKAVEDLRHYPGITPCEYCKHFVKPGVISEYCKLFDRSCFEWRGLEE